MSFPNVRLLVALDMHGATGTRRRRRVILCEFVVGAVGSIALGLWLLTSVTAVGWRLFGAWAVGVGVNYSVLTWRAVLLSRKGALDAELAGVDIRGVSRRYNYLQYWGLVPLLMAGLALGQVREQGQVRQP